MPSDAREDTSGVQAQRVSHDDNDDDDDSYIEERDVNGAKLQRHPRDMGKETQREKDRDPDDEERSAREIDRKVKEHDPRKSLMPRVQHRSTMEASFGMDTVDSQVQHMM